MKDLIAIVEDEEDIASLISIHAVRLGYRTKEFTNGKLFLDYLVKNTPNLILMDLMLPDMDGIELCKHIRSERKLKNIPIIIVSAKTDDLDKIVGLELGADDYVTKPFSIKELMARIKAILRRTSQMEVTSPIISIQNILVIDTEKYQVLVNGKSVNLTTSEFSLLKLLAGRKGWVFSRDKILDHLWGADKVVLDRTIDVHIKNIRVKLGEAGKFIHNIRGVGYKLDA